jgi:CheY-like chemotaxis protein
VERLLPDLILLDLGLPGMDGLEVARRLRATKPGRAARLVAVTGYGQESDREHTRAAGFDEHLLKPLGREALVAALSAVSRGA